MFKPMPSPNGTNHEGLYIPAPTAAYDAALGTPGRPHALHKSAKDTIPGDLSETSHLIANPSYVKTLKENGIPSLNLKNVPAEDDGEKPSTKPHDYKNFAPGVDAAFSDPQQMKKIRFAHAKLSPEDFATYMDMVLNDTDPPAEGDHTGFTPVGDKSRAMDAAIKAATGYVSRWGDRITAYPASDGSATYDLRVDDGFRFNRRGR